MRRHRWCAVERLLNQVLTTSRRLTASSDFTRTLHRGVRVKVHDLVVHVLIPPAEWPDVSGRRVDVAAPAPARFGFIVSKKVGNAVTRHAVSRRLRVACASVAGDTVAEARVVIRAFPSAADRGVEDLTAQVRRALRKAAALSPAAVSADDAVDDSVDVSQKVGQS